MKKNGTVRKGTNGQVAELFGKISQILLTIVQKLNFNQLRWLIGHKTEMTNAIQDSIEILVGKIPDFSDYIIWWQDFYRKEGIGIDFSSLQIPEKPEGDWWLIIVAPDMTYSNIIQITQKKFNCWFDDGAGDLDDAIDLKKERRRAVDGPYAIWVNANIEADHELKNKSANDLGAMSVITLLERLLLEIYFFSFISDGNHLDISNETLCAGSCCCRSYTPRVYWYGGGLHISWCKPDDVNDRLLARRVAS